MILAGGGRVGGGLLLGTLAVREACFGVSAQGSAKWKSRAWERSLGGGLGQVD